MIQFLNIRRRHTAPQIKAEFYPAIESRVPVEAWIVLNLELAGVTRRLPLLVADATQMAQALESGREGAFFLAQTPEQQRSEQLPVTLFVEGAGVHATLQLPALDIPVQAVDGEALVSALRGALNTRLN